MSNVESLINSSKSSNVIDMMEGYKYFTESNVPITAELMKKAEIKELEKILNTLTMEERALFFADVEFDWRFWAMEKQRLPKVPFMYWLILAGRGFGKTYTGANTIRLWIKTNKFRYCNLIGRTMHDVENVMVSGPSGILTMADKNFMPVWKKKDKCLEWPNGAKSLFFSADEPESLRGPQHSKVWADEICAWKYAKEAWDMMIMGLRIDSDPQVIVTTTPKKKHKLLSKIYHDEDTVLTVAKTKDNPFISDKSQKEYDKLYKDTKLGKQELEGEFDEGEGDEYAIFDIEAINRNRVDEIPDGVEIVRKIVSIDPSVSNNENSDECGIILMGLGSDEKVYVLKDFSGKMHVSKWTELAVKIFYQYECAYVVAETNQGGDLVENNLKKEDPNVIFRGVKAISNKNQRAAPVGGLYDQGKVCHVGPSEDFITLEDQMSDYDPITAKKSPDRMDALVWGVYDLLIRNTSYAEEWLKTYSNMNSNEFTNESKRGKIKNGSGYADEWAEQINKELSDMKINELEKIFGR